MSESGTLRIPVWRTPDADPGAVDDAAAALTDDLGPQIDWTVTVDRRGTVDLPGAPYETYGGYLDAFTEAASLESGTVNVCLYDYSVADVAADALDDLTDVLGGASLTSCTLAPDGDDDPIDDPPFAGYDHRPLAVDTEAVALVNAGLRPLPVDLLFENFVIHEVLHAMFDASNAPAPGYDHSFGTVTDGQATPMLTGYTEFYAANDPPPAACDLESVPEASGHTTDLARCAREEVNRYLREDFGGGSGG